MKAIWSGTLSFGLVSIPVKLVSIVESHKLGFKMLCGKCHSPITYERRCEKCKKKVAWDDIVKGLPLENEKYFIATPEEIKKLKPEKTDTISIVEFVDYSAIELIYFDKHYAIIPEAKGIKPFALFQKALEKTNKVAIGRFVMRDKEYTCAINPYENYLLLTTMHYEYEIRDIDVAALKKAPKITQAEITLATKLIKELTKKEFDMSQFKDTFAQELKKAIKAKGKKKTIAPKKKPKKKKEKSLMNLLKTSLKKQPTKTRQPVAQAKKAKKK